MSDLDKRLEQAVAKRDRLTAEAQRIAGRKEAAERALQEVESDIRAKNLDPDTLEETIQKLQAAFEKEVESFERVVESARLSLAPYMEIT